MTLPSHFTSLAGCTFRLLRALLASCFWFFCGVLYPRAKKRVSHLKMPIPEFDEHGLLPIGVHDCTAAEVAARFGVFQGNEQRPRLMAKLTDFLKEVRASGIVREVFVDGSFVTEEPSPNDIDLIVVLPSTHDHAADLLPLQYNVVSRKRVRSRFGFDTVSVRQCTTEHAASIEFFQQVRGEPGLRKGILRLTP